MSRTCWYFEFEGEYLDSAPVNADMGVFSSCLVPIADFNSAQEEFLLALERQHIRYRQVIEQFKVSEETMDMSNEENRFWIDWFEETLFLETTTFEQMYLYPMDDKMRDESEVYN